VNEWQRRQQEEYEELTDRRIKESMNKYYADNQLTAMGKISKELNFLHVVCRNQKTIKTSKLEEYLDVIEEHLNSMREAK
jgi:hypothetical protein